MISASSFKPSSLIYFLFILSGLTSLVYEIVWARILSTVLGTTSLAVSIIVSLFMLGLAVGSFLAARSRRLQRNPIATYAVLELFIGAYSVCTPRIARWVEVIYDYPYQTFADHFWWSVALKASIASLFLLLPTIAMGATLPVLVRAFRPEERGKRAGLLYGLNTAGAVAGTLLAGYILIPSLGIQKTIFLTAALNGLICMIALRLLKKPQTHTEADTYVKRFHPVYLLFFLTGFASLAYEILWTRALSMFFGSSVYAFSAILAAYLLGIACGSSYYSGRIRIDTDPYQFFSLIQFRLSLAAMFFVGIFMGIPYLLIWLFQVSYHSFPLFQLGQFVLIGCTIFYATFLSGAAFPAALHFFRRSGDKLQSYAGLIYSYNTVGSILGSIVAGFLLIPVFGVERSIRLIVLINLILGIYCFRRSDPSRYDRRVLAIGGVSLALLIFLPTWNMSIYNAGFYAFAYKYVPKQAQMPLSQPTVLQAGMFGGAADSEALDLLFYGEGLTANVAVIEHQHGVRSLLINGKPEASNVPAGDMRTQLLLGHLPVLLKGKTETALVIGLGSGVTSGALATHDLRKIDCVEIEQEVEKASAFFEKENLAILRNKSFRLILDDGRNFVEHTSERYDMITSEPSNLWISGVANLFTREFFQVAKSKLNSNGIMCQWIHLYQISFEDVLIFLKTFQSVFPYITLWVDESDMLVMGSDRPIRMNPRQMAEEMRKPDVAASLQRSGLTPLNVMERYAGDERMAKMLKPSLSLNTDDHPVLEFSAPKSLFWNRSEEIVRNLQLLRQIAERKP